MSGHEHIHSEASVSTLDTTERLSPDEQEAERIKGILEAFDNDRRATLRILSGPLLGMIHDIRLDSDGVIPEAEKERVTTTVAELVAAVDNLLRYQTTNEQTSEPTGEIAA